MRIRVSRWMWVFAGGMGLMGGLFFLRKGVNPAGIWDEVYPWLIVACAAGLHEIGHWVAAWWAGIRVRGIRLGLFGARMELEGLLSYGQECLVAAGGPFVNLICAAGAFPLIRGDYEAGVDLFFGASLVLCGVNLLPVGTLDGGRILHSGTACLFGERVADVLLKGTTGVFLSILWLIAVYGMLRGGQMLSLFVFSLCLLLRVIGGDGRMSMP